jgi:HEAT repeat protein
MSLEQRRNLLIELLNDSEEDVRTAASAALERLESFQDLSQSVKDLESDKRGERVKAIFAMEYVKSADVFPHLIKLLKDPDADIRGAAIQVLGNKAHPKSLSSLVKHLKDPSPAVRVHTAEALGHFSDVRLALIWFHCWMMKMSSWLSVLPGLSGRLVHRKALTLWRS